jgi:hypothetical protein
VFGSKTSSESQQTSSNDFFLTLGGVVGSCHARGGQLASLSNSGNVYVNDNNVAAIVGGVAGLISNFCGGVIFRNLSNSGGVYTNKKDASSYVNIGGIVGRIWMQNDAPAPVTLDSPVNTGYIHNETGGKSARIGGLVGLTPGWTIINDGVNKGNVTAWTQNGTSSLCYVGGLIGELWDLPCELNRCKEYGNVSYNNTASWHGLVIGYLEGKGAVKASACHASGTFGVVGGTVYSISSEADFASMVNAPSADKNVTEGKINIACLYNSSQSVGSPWEWNYHEAE